MTIKNRLREWITILNIIAVSAFFGYGIKTVYNGEVLGLGYWFLAVILFCTQITFYFLKDKNMQMNVEIEEAMASKIKFEADEHRKYRDRYNYVKMAYEEEE